MAMATASYPSKKKHGVSSFLKVATDIAPLFHNSQSSSSQKVANAQINQKSKIPAQIKVNLPPAPVSETSLKARGFLLCVALSTDESLPGASLSDRVYLPSPMWNASAVGEELDNKGVRLLRERAQLMLDIAATKRLPSTPGANPPTNNQKLRFKVPNRRINHSYSVAEDENPHSKSQRGSRGMVVAKLRSLSSGTRARHLSVSSWSSFMPMETTRSRPSISESDSCSTDVSRKNATRRESAGTDVSSWTADQTVSSSPHSNSDSIRGHRHHASTLSQASTRSRSDSSGGSIVTSKSSRRAHASLPTGLAGADIKMVLPARTSSLSSSVRSSLEGVPKLNVTKTQSALNFYAHAINCLATTMGEENFLTAQENQALVKYITSQLFPLLIDDIFAILKAHWDRAPVE